jgi:hypothetical protein
MSDHNNIYNIMGKLNALTPKEEHVAQPKQKVYESVEAKGSVLEGVSAVEARLTKQFAESDVVHKGKYGNDGDYTGKTGSLPKVQADPKDTKFDTKGIAGMIGKKPGKPIGKVTHHQKHEWDNSPEEVDEGDMEEGNDFSGKLDAARDAGEKEFTVGGNTYPVKEGGDPFANVDSRVAKPTIPGTKNKAKSAYYPSNKPGQVKKLDKPTNKYDNVKNEGEKPHPKELEMIGKTREMGIQNRARDAEQRMANRAAEPKNGVEYAAKTFVKHAKSPLSNINEGFNFADMMKETGSTVNEMLTELQDEIKTFEQTGHCGDKLEAFLKVHHHSKNRLMGETGNPRGYPTPSGVGAQHALELNPDLNPPLPAGGALGKIGGAIKTGATAVAGALGGPNDTGHLARLRDKMYKENAELNELAKLAGLAVQEGYEGGTCSACGMTECECDPGMDDVPGMESDGKISVNSSMSTDGDKHITVTADGGAVDELMQMLKIAGLDGFNSDNNDTSEVDVISVDGGSDQFADQLGDEEGVEEGFGDSLKRGIAAAAIAGAGATVMNPDNYNHRTPTPTQQSQQADQSKTQTGVEEEYANEPDESYGTIKNITTQGDDMHREKNMYGGPGDNGMTQRPNRPAHPVLALEAELAAEYESIKKSL